MTAMDLVTVAAAARELQVSEATIRNRADAGRLPHIRTSSGVRLFRRDELTKLKRTE